MLREKNTNQDKHDRKRDARQKKQLCTPRPHYVSTIVVFKHAAAIAVEPPATSSLADVAVRGLRRSVWLMAQFTIRTHGRTRHGAHLRRALRVCSSTCILVSVLRLSAVCVCVSNLHYCGAPRCPTCTIAVAPSIVQDLHYWALSVSRDFTCTIPGTCATQPAL